VSLVDLKVKVGKKYAVHLPREVVKRLEVSEDDEALLTVRGGEVVIKPVKRLLRPVRPWSSVGPEEVGEELSREALGEASP